MAQVLNPFRHLSKDILEMINSAHSAGKTPEQIGIQFGLEYEDVQTYLENFVVAPRSRFDRLQEIVDDLEDQCTQTRLELDSSRSAMMLQSYQKLMSEYRLALAELADIQNPQEVSDELIEKIFKPFVTDIIRVGTEETHKLQNELIRLGIQTRDARQTSVDIFKRLGERVAALLPVAQENLDRHLGVKKAKRTARAATKIEASDDPGKPTLQ